MPQMSPINWLSLFIMFTMIFIMFNMINYFSYNPLMPKFMNLNNKIMKSFFWKW